MSAVNQAARFVLLQVIHPHYHQDDALRDMQELEQLVKVCGGSIIEKSVQHRVTPHPATYMGSGKLEWLSEVVKTKKIDVVVINDLVKSGQLFRLERHLWSVNPKIRVWDRVDLILQIFDRHAQTKEAKLQIELARIKHEGPRVYGLGKTALSRQGGGRGVRQGSGETNIEKEKRVIKERVYKIQHELRRLSKQKRERIRFRNEQGIGPVALVGYTSAGKTTLFNTLTGKHKQTNKSLFTTLDTVVGKMKTPHHHLPILISDTIGFIEDLPPILIEAFQSTLIESLEAKLILHVVDAGDFHLLDKIEEVEKILEEMQIQQPIILVFNKLDQVDEKRKQYLAKHYAVRPHIFVSAQEKVGIHELKSLINSSLDIFSS